MIFNCAPARGATNRRKKMQQSSYISTHAPARGAADLFREITDSNDISTHTPARGATAKNKQKQSLINVCSPHNSQNEGRIPLD